MENFILKSNLETALYIAIKQLKKEETLVGKDYISCLRAALEENLKKMESGIPLEIR